MDDEEQPRQIFHASVGQVSGRDIINNPSPATEPRLGALKWINKQYPFGKNVSTKQLVFVPLIGIVLMIAKPSFTSWINDLLFLLAALLMLVGLLLSQLHFRGCFYWGEGQSGLFKDENGAIFWGQLGGDGILCPKCKARLALSREENSDFLRCTRHRPHHWLFDPTDVRD